MIFIFNYVADSLTIHNCEDTNDTQIFEAQLGRLIVGLNPLKQGHERRWLVNKIKRLGFTPKEEVINTLMHGLRTRNHVSVDLFI